MKLHNKICVIARAQTSCAGALAVRIGDMATIRSILYNQSLLGSANEFVERSERAGKPID
jgi:hypothetical protein